MVTPEERQAIVDAEHLRLLPVGYWVLGGFDIFFSLYGLIYIVFGALITSMPAQWTDSASGPPPAFLGWSVCTENPLKSALTFLLPGK